MSYAFVCLFAAVPPQSGAGRVSHDLARFVPGSRVLIQLGPEARAWRAADDLRVVQIRQGGGRAGKLLGLPCLLAKIVARLRDQDPDVVVLEGASWILYHWRLLGAVRQALPGATVVYHAHNVEVDLRRQKHGLLVTSITRWAEAKLLRGVDLAFAVSEVDRDLFHRLYGVRPSLLPNGVDVSAFSDIPEDDVRAVRERYGLGSETVLFMGSYRYQPNREAIDFLVERVLPRLLEHRPGVQFVVTGGDVPYARPWLSCLGIVPDEDVVPLVAGAGVSVAPIFSGSGTRLKILVSLAAGTPVVATAKGAEGLDLEDGREIQLAESDVAFAERVLEILAAPEAAREVARRGCERVREAYDWRPIAAAFHAEVGRQRGS